MENMNNDNTHAFAMPKCIYMTRKCSENILNSFFYDDPLIKHIIFDFHATEWISAEAAPFLGTLVNHAQDRGQNVFFYKLNNTFVRNLLEKNGFMKYYGLSENVKLDRNNTTMPYTVLDSNDDEGIDQFLEDKVFSLIHQHIDGDEIEIIRDAVNEVAHNVKDHSSKSNVYICGQFYPKKKEICLTLCDNGVTIPYNIQRKYKHINLSSESIDFATEKGKSTKHTGSSGLGLYDIKENILNIGELSILSSNAFWHQDIDGKIKKTDLDNSFPGTAVSLKFLLDGHKKKKKVNKSVTLDTSNTINLFF